MIHGTRPKTYCFAPVRQRTGRSFDHFKRVAEPTLLERISRHEEILSLVKWNKEILERKSGISYSTSWKRR